MQTYGRGQMLGASINPQLMIQDYSGFVNAANTQAQAIAGLGQSLVQAAGAYKQNKQEASQMNAQVKASENFLTSAKTLFGESNPALSQMIDQTLAISSDPKMSLAERSAYLNTSVQGLGSLVSSIQQLESMDINRQKLGLERQALGIRQQAAASGSGTRILGD